jgi:hypothetical protein
MPSKMLVEPPFEEFPRPTPNKATEAKVPTRATVPTIFKRLLPDLEVF